MKTGAQIMKYEVDFGDKKIMFAKRGRKAVKPWKDTDDYVVNASIIAADGTKYNGLVIIDAGSSGEHYETFIMTDSTILKQSDDNFLKILGKHKKEFFPYKYKYRAKIPCYDIHLDENGWSL